MRPPAPRLFFLLVLLAAVRSTQSRLEGSGAARVRPSPTEFSARYLEDTDTDGGGGFTEDVETEAVDGDEKTKKDEKNEDEKDEEEKEEEEGLLDEGLLDGVTAKVNNIADEGEAVINTPISDWETKEWSIAGASILGAIGILACIFKCFCPFC